MKLKKQIVEWHDSYSVGIRLVDEQHKELINLTNRLHEASVQGWDKSKVAFMSAIRGMVDYVGYHFSTEEKIMERVNYPDYKVHKKEHSDFVKEVLRQVQDFQADQKVSANDLVLFLKDWVLAHIAVCDKKMGMYLIKLKREGALHNITMKVKQETPATAGTEAKRLVIK
ncbi:MAG: bacteriohemerythrin [Treponema sp.]|jgi:hemerythrin|nr:bacteriohemerythrin [Treponema sp.]